MTKLKFNKNSAYGQNIESLFKNSIGANVKAQEAIRKQFDLERTSKIEKAYKTGQESGKVDAFLRFSCGKTIGVNIKAYSANTGFNQLTRLTLDNFSKRFGISNNLKSILKRSILDVAKNTKSLFIAERQGGSKERNIKTIK